MMERDLIEANRIIDQLLVRVAALETADLVLSGTQPRGAKSRTLFYNETDGQLVVVGPVYRHTFTKDT